MQVNSYYKYQVLLLHPIPSLFDLSTMIGHLPMLTFLPTNMEPFLGRSLNHKVAIGHACLAQTELPLIPKLHPILLVRSVHELLILNGLSCYLLGAQSRPGAVTPPVLEEVVCAGRSQVKPLVLSNPVPTYPSVMVKT